MSGKSVKQKFALEVRGERDVRRTNPGTSGDPADAHDHVTVHHDVRDIPPSGRRGAEETRHEHEEPRDRIFAAWITPCFTEGLHASEEVCEHDEQEDGERHYFGVAKEKDEHTPETGTERGESKADFVDEAEPRRAVLDEHERDDDGIHCEGDLQKQRASARLLKAEQHEDANQRPNPVARATRARWAANRLVAVAQAGRDR